jgi:hypothetical protein
MAGRNSMCSGSDLFNSTDNRLILSEDETSDNQIGGILKTFVKLIYLEEILHYSIGEVFNIF